MSSIVIQRDMSNGNNDKQIASKSSMDTCSSSSSGISFSIVNGSDIDCDLNSSDPDNIIVHITSQIGLIDQMGTNRIEIGADDLGSDENLHNEDDDPCDDDGSQSPFSSCSSRASCSSDKSNSMKRKRTFSDAELPRLPSTPLSASFGSAAVGSINASTIVHPFSTTNGVIDLPSIFSRQNSRPNGENKLNDLTKLLGENFLFRHNTDAPSSYRHHGAPSSTDSSDTDSEDLGYLQYRSVHQNYDSPSHLSPYNKGGDDLKEEYNTIVHGSIQPDGHFHHSKKLVNRVRNRYPDVLCFDHTRVKLHSDENDYINASYCDGFQERRSYICTQGPTPTTSNHFWQMIWENNVRVAVMTTRLLENGRIKCHRYWPHENEERWFGDYHIRDLGSIQMEPEYILQTLEITYQSQTRTIYHYQFTQWPDFGIPSSANAIIEFQDAVRRKHSQILTELNEQSNPEYQVPLDENEDPFSISPIVVHCSAGIGRTGTYVTIDICRRWLEETSNISISETVKRIRAQRANSVQTHQQYQFCHNALLQIAQTAKNNNKKQETNSSPSTHSSSTINLKASPFHNYIQKG